MIDLRSDTVTRPTAAMRAAISDAPVGDDVYGDDPSVNRLQAMICERTGKQAAAFFPSGTQSNLAAIMAHCARGDEYLVGQLAHTYKFEGGGAAVLGSIQPQPIEHAEDGSLPLAKLEEAIKPVNFHFARTRLLALENTFGGQVIDQDYIVEACSLARRYGLATHLDGARISNAAVASGLDLATLCEPFDTVSICLSKGLGAPQGSLLVGSHELVEASVRWRKMLGGGMRQSGMMAAAGLYALEHQFDRLADDHRNAERLAAGLAEVGGVKVLRQATNMVFLEVPEAHWQGLGEWLRERDIIVSVGSRTRLVTHLEIGEKEIDQVIAAFTTYFGR
ncbi:low-specificity L-threonine aldolase [Halotalea alkalilenta]|uniref:Threonine aldolase n=1 Tax=Halotalea alkalilenta TaxID=376489 RepID=A0A172YCW9_9GAMM|nr:low-specificity L-threonine aldolase [Halotalea alkalilenta]ANF57101.1 threonine aldolase [Halotalea alkalilenta]